MYSIHRNVFRRVRGQLGTLVMVSRSFGILLIFIADNFLSYQTIILYLTAIPVVFLSVFGFFPESPQYLMLKSEPTKAEHSLKLYRNCRLASRSESEFYQHELQKFQTNCRLVGQSTDSNTNRDKLTFGDFGEYILRTNRICIIIHLTFFKNSQPTGPQSIPHFAYDFHDERVFGCLCYDQLHGCDFRRCRFVHSARMVGDSGGIAPVVGHLCFDDIDRPAGTTAVADFQLS